MTPVGRLGPRRVLVLVVAGLAGVVAVLGLIAGLRLLAVADDLDEARRLIASAGEAIDARDLTTAEDELTTASELLVGANNRLHSSIALELVGDLPVVSANVRVVEDSVGLAMQIALGGRELLAASDPLQVDDRLEVPLSEGAFPLDAVHAVQRELAALAAVLPTAEELPDSRFLLPAVRDARADLYQEASRRREQADVLSRALDLLVDMAGGNGARRHLVAVADTAEMRGSGGMILSYGVLTGTAGDFDLEHFGPIDELELASAVPEEELRTVPDDVLARWEGFDPLRNWRNANLAADFELIAPVLEAMYEQATGVAVDGVIQIDPQGLAAILEGTGPVTVGELGEVRSDNLVDLTLNGAYQQFPGVEARSDVLGDVAEAVFRKLVDGTHESLRGLAGAVSRAVASRHIQVHSPVGTSLARLRSFDATGALPGVDEGDAFHLTVQNMSGHKLDYYLDTAVSLVGERRAGAPGDIDVTVTLANGAPAGRSEPSYLFEPSDPELAAGSYRGVVSLYAPRGTTLVSFDGEAVDEPVVVTEGRRPVVSFTVDIAAGERRTFGLELSMPPASSDQPYDITAVPSPRVRPTTFTADIQTHAGRVTGDVVLDRSWTFRPRRPPAPVEVAG